MLRIMNAIGLPFFQDAVVARYATDAKPDEVKQIVAPTRPSAVVLVGERFGTVRLHYDNEIIEITTFRSEQYNAESRKTLESRFPPFAKYLKPIVTSGDVWLYEITSYPAS